MTPNPNCPFCQGHGQWYSPDNGQIVTCDCGANTKPSGITAKNVGRAQAVFGKLNKPLERFVQLHQTIEIVYVVDGYLAKYMVTDGQICERTVKGETILEALHLLEVSLQIRPPQFGGPK